MRILIMLHTVLIISIKNNIDFIHLIGSYYILIKKLDYQKL